MPILTPTLQTNNSTTGSNNGIKDPFQGFDATLWMLNANGEMVNRGFFTSVQLTFRNATEPYMEMSQRVPRYLDGDFQIGWVAQRGMLDVGVLEETMGFAAVSREARISRSPRFNLVVYINAPELKEAAPGSANKGTAPGAAFANPNNIYQSTQASAGNYARKAQGKIVLLNCKLDTFAVGIQSGQRVIANQWEGLSEGYQVITTEGSFATEEASLNRTVLNKKNLAGGGNFQFGVPGASPDALSSFYK